MEVRMNSNTRRDFLRVSALIGAGLLLSGCEREGTGTVEKKEGPTMEGKKEAIAQFTAPPPPKI
jgi:hypothetical protein